MYLRFVISIIDLTHITCVTVTQGIYVVDDLGISPT
jgi:hypothetical protein